MVASPPLPQGNFEASGAGSKGSIPKSEERSQAVKCGKDEALDQSGKPEIHNMCQPDIAQQSALESGVEKSKKKKKQVGKLQIASAKQAAKRELLARPKMAASDQQKLGSKKAKAKAKAKPTCR